MLKPHIDMSIGNYLKQQSSCIEIIEYGDFQCEHCANVFPVIKCLEKILGLQMKFDFRHFPLANLHPLALECAIASEAAALQNKFWSMHDIIFNNQKYLTRSTLLEFAEVIKLDVRLFQISRERKEIFSKVISDFDSGVNRGVYETPTFFINGFRYRGKNDLDSLYRACHYQLALKESEYRIPQNIYGGDNYILTN
jgi:protein-disulfide isomerase